MSDRLNVKQEKFIQGIINGLSQRQAYKEAYNAQYADKDIDSKASNLFNSDKVQTRYKQLLEKIQDESIMSAKERQEWLSKFIKGSHLSNDKLRALDILNKMTGEYIQKIDANVTSEIKVTLEDD